MSDKELERLRSTLPGFLGQDRNATYPDSIKVELRDDEGDYIVEYHMHQYVSKRGGAFLACKYVYGDQRACTISMGWNQLANPVWGVHAYRKGEKN